MSDRRSGSLETERSLRILASPRGPLAYGHQARVRRGVKLPARPLMERRGLYEPKHIVLMPRMGFAHLAPR